MRVQGGFSGIMAAIDAGRLDPFDGSLPEKRDTLKRSHAEQAQLNRLQERRARWIASFLNR